MEENFPATLLPVFLTTIPDCAAALLGGFAFDRFEFDLLILLIFLAEIKLICTGQIQPPAAIKVMIK